MSEKADFRVKLGDIVQMQFIPEDNRERLNAKVIGHAPNRSLIISAPSVGGRLPILRENQRFVMRMLQGNRVYGFESEVLKYYTLPYPHVHLSQPKEIESIVVRGSRRVNTEIIVSAQSKDDTSGKPVSVTMRNTSATGALLQTTKNLGTLGDQLQISAELDISGIKKYLRISATIRNVSTPEDREDTDPDGDTDTYRFGIQFAELTDEQKLVITAYVHEQIVMQLED
ncbi:MAG: flagellar brake protein [Gammaproteobacteria bacterium]|nr:flagellar brake protein [Gammaproteobacteria bacterium]